MVRLPSVRSCPVCSFQHRLCRTSIRGIVLNFLGQDRYREDTLQVSARQRREPELISDTNPWFWMNRQAIAYVLCPMSVKS